MMRRRQRVHVRLAAAPSTPSSRLFRGRDQKEDNSCSLFSASSSSSSSSSNSSPFSLFSSSDEDECDDLEEVDEHHRHGVIEGQGGEEGEDEVEAVVGPRSTRSPEMSAPDDDDDDADDDDDPEAEPLHSSIDEENDDEKENQLQAPGSGDTVAQPASLHSGADNGPIAINVEQICQAFISTLVARLRVVSVRDHDHRDICERLDTALVKARSVAIQRDWYGALSAVIDQLHSLSEIPELRLESEPLIAAVDGDEPVSIESIQALVQQISVCIKHVKTLEATEQRGLHQLMHEARRVDTAAQNSEHQYVDAAKTYDDLKAKAKQAQAAYSESQRVVADAKTAFKNGLETRGQHEADLVNVLFYTSTDPAHKKMIQDVKASASELDSCDRDEASAKKWFEFWKALHNLQRHLYGVVATWGWQMKSALRESVAAARRRVMKQLHELERVVELKQTRFDDYMKVTMAMVVEDGKRFEAELADEKRKYECEGTRRKKRLQEDIEDTERATKRLKGALLEVESMVQGGKDKLKELAQQLRTGEGSP